MKEYQKPEILDQKVLHLNEEIAAGTCEIDFDYKWQNRNHNTGTGDNYGFGSKQAAYDASFNSVTPPVSHSGEQGVVGPIHKITIPNYTASHEDLIWYWEDYNADMRMQLSNFHADEKYDWYPDERFMHGIRPDDPTYYYLYHATTDVLDNLQGVETGYDYLALLGPNTGLIIRS